MRNAILATILLAAGPACAADLLPEGIAAFFTEKCPEGWRSVVPAEGRLILGTLAPDRIRKISGSKVLPLSSAAAPTHTHSFDIQLDQFTNANDAPAAFDCCNPLGAKPGPSPTYPHVTAATSMNLPFIYLPFCEK